MGALNSDGRRSELPRGNPLTSTYAPPTVSTAEWEAAGL